MRETPTLTKDMLTFNLFDILEQLSAEDVRALADRLACYDAVIEDVASQLLTGWTEAMSCGMSAYTGEADPYSPLDKARRQIALQADEVAATEIQGLSDALRHTKAQYDQINGWAWNLYHAVRRLGATPTEPPAWRDLNDAQYRVVRVEPQP